MLKYVMSYAELKMLSAKFDEINLIKYVKAINAKRAKAIYSFNLKKLSCHLNEKNTLIPIINATSNKLPCLDCSTNGLNSNKNNI